MSKSREAERDKQLVKWRKERGEVILIEIYEENREREIELLKREKDIKENKLSARSRKSSILYV